MKMDGHTAAHQGGLAYDYIAPRKYLEVQYVAGYILPKDATEDHPATLPADLEAIVWYMIAQQWAIIENDARRAVGVLYLRCELDFR